MKSHSRNEQRTFREKEPEMVSLRSVVNKYDSETQIRLVKKIKKEFNEIIKTLPPGWDDGLAYESEEEYLKDIDAGIEEINKRKNPWD